MSTQSPISRWNAVSRAMAALFGGYALAYGSTAFLAVYLPLARADRVVFASLLCFFVWTGAAIYAFAARSALRAWLWLVLSTVVLCLAAFLPGDFGARP